ncbi:type II secretory protein PulC [Sphingomonas sp. Leaf17]|nr:type II secretory protein PulC [Sphingomonas sp. Leaf17]
MRLKVDARARRMVRRLPVINIYSFAELVLLAGLATQAARLLWAIATPVGPLGDWRPAAPALSGTPVEILSGFDPFFRLAGQAGPSVVTTLQLQLFGIRIDEAMGRGSAIIAGPDKVQNSWSVGDEILPGVRLKAVAFDHVVIDRGGVDEDLFLDQSGGTGAAPVVTGGLPAGGAAGAGIPIGQLKSEIGFIPRIDNGRLSGLVVRSAGTGAAFRQAGLQDGDVVTAIGGRPVTGPNDLERVSADFAGGGNIPITVERGGQTLPLAITIAAP